LFLNKVFLPGPKSHTHPNPFPPRPFFFVFWFFCPNTFFVSEHPFPVVAFTPCPSSQSPPPSFKMGFTSRQRPPVMGLSFLSAPLFSFFFSVTWRLFSLPWTAFPPLPCKFFFFNELRSISLFPKPDWYNTPVLLFGPFVSLNFFFSTYLKLPETT